MAENQFDTVEEIGDKPADICRRWFLELDLYKKNTSAWRSDAQKVWDRYRIKSRARNSFNILWANTETLRPAVYNSVPSPDVRRRFKDADPVGRLAAEMLSRCLEFTVDQASFDSSIRSAVLDMLLPSRGVCRVRYVPSLRPGESDGQEQEAKSPDEIISEVYEELDFEQVCVEHVQWDDFAHGAGRSWDEVTWIGFRHRLTRDELIEKFGEDIGGKVELNDTDVAGGGAGRQDRLRELFSYAEVWEIWDKDEREVVFVSDGYREGPLSRMDDPLGLAGFFPTPCPLYCIEDSGGLIPIILYSQYEEQARELDVLNARMNILIDAVRVRGAYDGSMPELASIMAARDNQLVPIQNAIAFADRGGLQNAIFFMPIDTLVTVIRELSAKAEQCKQVIYELTGIADIMRGASNPSETATAQSLKSRWSTGRLSRLQMVVAHYIRDLVRLCAEIIAEKFQPATLLSVSGLKIPTLEQAQVQAMQQQQIMLQRSAAQYQAAVQQAVQDKQPIPPMPSSPQMPQLPVVLEQVVGMLQDDALRNFRIDIETDSTIAAHQQQDMGELKDAVLSINQALAQSLPFVQAGVMPMDAAKEILLSIVRRARLGNSVEDAIDRLQQPQAPAQAPGSGKQSVTPEQQIQIELQKAAIEARSEQKKAELRAQTEQSAQSARAQTDIAIASMQSKFDSELQQLKVQTEAQLAVLSHQLELVRIANQPRPQVGFMQNAVI